MGLAAGGTAGALLARELTRNRDAIQAYLAAVQPDTAPPAGVAPADVTSALSGHMVLATQGRSHHLVPGRTRPDS